MNNWNWRRLGSDHCHDTFARDTDSLWITLTCVIVAAVCLWTGCTQPRVSGPPAQSVAKPSRVVPTNSLAFHLQSLGRTPTEDERKVIERALELMQRYQVRSDPPLRSVRHDRKANLWHLHFDNGDPNGSFTIFLRNADADWFYMLPTMVASRGHRVPPQKR